MNRSRRLPWLLVPALVGAPGGAWAGGAEVEALALAALDQPETLDGGALIGPPASRATWYSLGGLRPFSGAAMAVFSTGVVDGVAWPGTDLSTVGVADDRAGVNFSLEAPADARSLRVALRVVARPELRADAASLLDRIRVEVSGDPVALDPWSLGDLSPASVGLAQDDEGLLDGTPHAGSLLSPWFEAVIPVQPLAQLPLRFEVSDGGDDPRGDLLMFVDGIRFDSAVPLSVPPGIVPRVIELAPTRLPELLPTDVVLQGVELPSDGVVSLVAGDGTVVLTLGEGALDRRSRERWVLHLPALEEGVLGLRLRWGDGAQLTWPEALRVDTPPPSIGGLRPDVSPPRGGGLAVLDGAGFYDVSSVRVGDALATDLRVVSPTRIELVMPAGPVGPARVLVIAAGGSAERDAVALYSGPVTQDEAPVEVPGGPTVLDCEGSGGAVAALGLVAVGLPMRARRRRC